MSRWDKISIESITASLARFSCPAGKDIALFEEGEGTVEVPYKTARIEDCESYEGRGFERERPFVSG
jgi:hypothetical protein